MFIFDARRVRIHEHDVVAAECAHRRRAGEGFALTFTWWKEFSGFLLTLFRLFFAVLVGLAISFDLVFSVRDPNFEGDPDTASLMEVTLSSSLASAMAGGPLCGDVSARTRLNRGTR